ncbi:exonuclease subunit SbcD [Catenovulum sediminis]|uniref:exonuclease subunit SbcD n=1 Tax=Catenovulum sediminis TaxID=1740262 RepID=UPI001180AA44
MRIIHTSDWHLGQNFYGKSRAPEHSQFFAWLIQQIEERQVDVLIVAGDLFDTGAPPSYARALLNEFVVKLSKTACQLILLGGNHDSVAMLNESKQVYQQLNTELQAQAQAQPQCIDQQVFELKNRNGEAAAIFCAIPYIRPRDVLYQNTPPDNAHNSDLLTAIQSHYQSLYRYAQQLRQDRPLPIIGSGHLTLVNAKTSDSVREIYIGSLEAVPLHVLPDFDYLALGHIHQPQIIAEQQHIRYSGSPIAMSFDEAKQQKSVVLIEFTQQQKHIQTLKIPCSQTLKQIKGSLSQIETCLQALAVDEQGAWLDIEVDSHDYHSDIQQQISRLCEDYPVEALLVRRKKITTNPLSGGAQSAALDEMTPDQVFQQKLQEHSFDEKTQDELSSLFNKAYHQAINEAANENT